MRYTVKYFFCILIFTISLNGCATLTEGDKDSIIITSDQDSVEININGKYAGFTPKTIALKRGNDYRFDFLKEGFKDKTYLLTSSIGLKWVVLDIVFGVVGLIVDAFTKDWYDFKTNVLKIKLQPER